MLFDIIKDNIALFAIFATPIIAAVVGFIFNKLGLGGKLRQAEYYSKRLRIVKELLDIDKNTVRDFNLQYDRELIKSEIDKVFEYIRKTSHSKAEAEIQIFHKRSLPKRILFLPKPRTAGG